VAEHYQAKLVVEHIVELWRHPSAGFAVSVALYDEFCQSVGESGKEPGRTRQRGASDALPLAICSNRYPELS
jgi:hypothetical protein